MDILPEDGLAGVLIGRAWVPGDVPGPAPVVVREGGVFDLSALAPTVSDLLDMPDVALAVRRHPGRRIACLEEISGNAGEHRDVLRPHLLAPCDLQVIKAAGVTFAASMVERVIEEKANGDASKAESIRNEIASLVGANLRGIVPGSPKALELKHLLMARGMWSQYLEVGIGPDAEIFTKAPVLAAVGHGARIGIHPGSEWNNPEPEVVLAVTSDGRIVGATLGNDVNLRDFEGRSALLLSKAKDNNASCAIGPFIRLFDDTFSLDDVRNETVRLRVEGLDGFVLEGESSMREISRDPADLVRQTLNDNHQYPDGFLLFLGTLFAPVVDRAAPGAGFTHHMGDRVVIESARLGALANEVTHSNIAEPWRFGVRALMDNLARRGLLSGSLA